MPDEAVVRIILDEGSGRGGGGSTQPPAPAAPPPQSFGSRQSSYTPPPPSAPATAIQRPTAQAPTTAPTTQIQTAPPAPPKSAPVPVEMVKPPPPPPPPAAPSATTPGAPAQEPEWLQSLIDPMGHGAAGPHVLLEGESGGGKTYAARHIAHERMRRGEDVHVLDPQTPSMWGGAKQVFQGQSGATKMAEFMEGLLESRKRQAQESQASGGGMPDFKPVTIVLSDFAEMMRNTPQLREAVKLLLEQARKFNIQILAETQKLSVQSMGAGGVTDIRRNLAQQVEFSKLPGEQPVARTDVGAFPVPELTQPPVDTTLAKPTIETDLPQEGGSAAAEARRRLNERLIKAQVEVEEQKLLEQPEYASLRPPPPKAETEFDPMEAAKKRIEAEDRRAKVDAAYAEMRPPKPPPPPPPFDPLAIAQERVKAEDRRAKVDAEYAKLKPPKRASGMDALLESLESVRGTLSGVFGRVLGSVLDISARYREIRERAEKAKQAVAPIEVPTTPTAPTVEAPEMPAVKTAPTSVAPTTKAPEVVAARAEVKPPEVSAPLVTTRAVPATPTMIAPTPEPVMARDINPKESDVEYRRPSKRPAIASVVPTPPPAAAEAPGGTGSATSAAVAAIPYVGIALAIGGAIKGAIGDLMDSINSRVEKYAQYNPEVAQAQAQAEIKTIMGDMRRSRETSQEMAGFIQAQTEAQQRFEDIKVKVLSKIVPVLTQILEVVGGILGIARNAEMDDIKDPTTLILDRASVEEARKGAHMELDVQRDIIGDVQQ